MIDKSIKRIDVEVFMKYAEDYLDRIEDGEMFVLTVNGEEKAVIMPVDDYNTLQNEIEYLSEQTDDQKE